VREGATPLMQWPLPRRLRLQTVLLGLGLVLLVPALSLGAVSAWSAVGAYRDAFEARLRDTARALALAADREIGTHMAAITALAASSALDGDDPQIAAFEREARRAAAGLGTSLVLLDATSLRQLINTALPVGAPTGAVSAADFGRVARTGQPLVTDLVIGAVARHAVVGVAVPVERDGVIRFVLAARLALPRLSGLLEAQASPGRAFDEDDERRMLLVREVDHRAKNALAVALSVVRLTPNDVAPEHFAASVEGRVAAMARAHSLLAQEAWSGADLRTLAEEELAPHAGRIQFAGASTHLPPEAVQPMAMLLHELATNAVKHGALSSPEGQVALSWEVGAGDGGLRLSWAERGGPAVAGPPVTRRFGTRLIAQLADRQLHGRSNFDWRAEGLHFALSLPPLPATPDGAVRRMPAPEAAGVSADAPDRTGPAQAAGPPLRVLVVEDEVLLSLEVEAALRELGYEVVGPARDLAEALRLAVNETDLYAAILDVNLGGRERSFPVADLLQTRDVPYIFVTGYGSASALAGREAGSAAVLRKPYARQALADALGAVARSS